MADPGNPIRDVMSRGAISVDEKLTLRSLAAVLVEFGIGVALVTGPGGSTGIVSERDIVHALANGAEPDEIWAADVTRTDMVFAEPEEPIVDIAERMSIEGIRHVAIAERGTIVGVVSARDVLPVLTDHVRATL